MTDYSERVKALRVCGSIRYGIRCISCPYNGKGCHAKLCTDAADAIEALQAAEPTEKQVVDYCHKRCLVVLEADLFHELKASYGKTPKRGEWIEERTEIVCSKCHARFSDEIIFMNQNMEGEALKYCPNCGAKMEVQDGK